MPPRVEAVRFENVRFTYAGRSEPALAGISFGVPPGRFVLVMGRTGSGKSTLAKCLNRIVPCFQRGRLEGRILLDGEPTEGKSVADLAGRVGVVLQDFEAQLFATDVEQEIAFGLEQLGVPGPEIRARIDRVLALLGIEHLRKRDPNSLSGGEKQRLAIAAVLALEPRVLVFDEPTTDLDPEAKHQVFETLRELRARGLAAVVAEHEIDATDFADRLVLLDGGRIVAEGPAAELRKDVPLLLRCGVRPRDLDRVVRALGIRASGESVEEVERAIRRELGGPASAQAAASAENTARAEPILEVRDVSFSYADEPVLADVSLRFEAGAFTALIGPNGSGKSTLAKILTGLLRPSHGRVLWKGENVTARSARELATRIGYVFQDPDHQLFCATVREEVAFGPKNLGVPEPELSRRVSEALRALRLEGLEEEDPFVLTKGQRQRLAIAAVLAQRPEFLVLDEPTTGLDYEEQQAVLELLSALNRQGLSLLVITHSPWVVAEYARKAVVLLDGRVAFEGTLRDLFRRSTLVERARFRVPDVTRLSLRFGFAALGVPEFVSAFRVDP
ncbi:MAG: cobalt ABC transporter ATP-binding protein [Candidatus Binatia bacterium]|nr:MAG: cobalt ABC transporter ATP-binding protein [Candidatus Binatia bacterium]